MLETIRQRFLALQPQADFCSLRYVEEDRERLHVRQGRQQPLSRSHDRGAMIVVIDGGGYGYAATADLSEAGLRAAFARAKAWARATAGCGVFDYRQVELPSPFGRYAGPGSESEAPWRRAELLGLLMEESAAAKGEDARIVDWSAGLVRQDIRQLYLTSRGGEAEQRFRMLTPSLTVTAFADGRVQTRSLGGQYGGMARQGAEEALIAEAGLAGAGRRVADEALQLLHAPNCPSGKMDLLLMPEQMMLQIHESIGHPLELDRILGDERNYAGTSFVTLDMFGHYQYGSSLLNVTFDPLRRQELASYGWDDDGKAADKTWLIRNGVLERPLGGDISSARAGLEGIALDGVANSRGCNWNRPAIDRMANLNVEPGDKTFEQLVAGVERGVLMQTNVSWSIDDSRNKFQFGCEWGQLIEDGELKGVVRNPNYRGISANFWRSLRSVGDESTLSVLGTPYCGKGEPNQVVRVGHASPACVFGEVDVFGGAA
ncbi:TldD/PmbA family protein [Chromobacterium subtsugae]|uniref:TldD/PmbA family protein n=1 Tax=Chromobacterium subtsugae TaxID=251747 RepID=UPI000640C486|nr:TldD/PmbA family protein [Chromobacterium subtsugae]